MLSRLFPLPCLTLCCTMAVPLHAEPAMLNALERPGLDLNSTWHVIVDPYDTG